MRALLETVIILGVVVLADINDFGIEFVIIWCAIIALYLVWVSRLRTEVIMYMAGIPNNLRYWLFMGLPMGLAARTLALALVLVPVYILCP